MQQPPVCSKCGTVPEPGETFCGNCGNRLSPPAPQQQWSPPVQPPLAQPRVVPPPVVTPPQPAAQFAAPPKKSVLGKVLLLGCLGLVVVLSLAGGGVGFYVWRRASYTPPVRKPPQLPQRAAGTMTEFPVDNDQNNPAQPTSVATQNLTAEQTGGSTSQSGSAPQSLPPGVDRSGLSKRASSITTATYSATSGASSGSSRPSSTPGSTGAGQTASDAGQVYVNVLEAQPGVEPAGESIAGSVAQATGGERTGVRVQSPNGSTYSGSRIRSSQGTAYVLDKQGANIVIIIYAPDPSAQDIADRLARNVGNGQGLNDYPQVKDSLWTLPATPPSGLTLQEVNTLTREDMERSFAGSSGGAQGDEDTRKILEQMRQFIPERLTSARYTDAARQDWGAIEFDYGSGFSAWKTWMLARSLLGVSGSQSTKVLGEDALYIDKDDKRILIFQKGPYFVVLMSPSSAPVERLADLGNQFQL